MNRPEIEVSTWIDKKSDMEMVKLVCYCTNDKGLPEKRGVILRVSPEDLPIVLESYNYPEYFLGYLLILDGGH